MKPKLPPGVCLTDAWPHLTPTQKATWLRIVSREARGVALEVQGAQAAARTAAINAPRVAAEQQAADSRRAANELLAALRGHVVGRPRKARAS